MDMASPAVVIDRRDFDAIFTALKGRGFQIVGPTRRDEAIVYDEIHSAADLPAGWSDVQEASRYRLRKRADQALFGYAVGPHSWKPYLLPPALRLWRAERGDQGFVIEETTSDPPRLALLGVRACELNAIAIQDRVFRRAATAEPDFCARRENLFVIALQCSQAGGTCFCVSMGSGPEVESGFDLVLTEVLGAGSHYFVAVAGSAGGAALLGEIPHHAAGAEERERADHVVAQTAAQMGRSSDTTHVKELLYANADHPRWDDVAARCLTCGNCTMVCPTCFCTTVEDVTDLSGEHAERWRKWESCFSVEFSYLHGGAVRSSARSRYRQWLTHKMATWIDQFGTSGCVGCGRCITWCPVGIDITEELRAIRGTADQEAPP